MYYFNMSKERFKLIPAVYLMPIRDGKVLLSRRFNTGYDDGNYSLVAGHLDGGEHPKAMVREALEEANMVVKEEDLEFVNLMHRITNDERVDFFFTVKNWEGDIKIMEPDKCDDLQWFDLNNLPENTNKAVKKAIQCYVDGIYYCESVV